MTVNEKPEARVRRKRDPEATREAILKAARSVLAGDGQEGLSVARVARMAGVNRGTAYQHFQTREDLLKATAEWVSERLLSEDVFASPSENQQKLPPHEQPVFENIERVVEFAVENPELGRVWLFEVLASDNPSEDRFFQRYKEGVEVVSKSKLSQKGVDAEALSVLLLAGCFLWPVWVSAHAHTKKARKRLAQRFSREVLRLTLYGSLKPEHYPNLEKLLEEYSE